jgi:hypothetical protein
MRHGCSALVRFWHQIEVLPDFKIAASHAEKGWHCHRFSTRLFQK